MNNRRVREALTPIGALGATLLVAAGILAIGGYHPSAVLSVLWRGAAGSPQQLLSVTFVRATPLVLTGLAVALAFRAGIWNIGAEGQLYAGAIAGAFVALRTPWLPGWILIPSVLLAAGLAGAAWAWIPSVMKLRLGVGEVITTLLMNFVGIYAAAFVVHGPLQESRGVFPQTDTLPDVARLPVVPGTRMHVGFLVAVALAVGLWGVLRFTPVGFRIRAIGASPSAAAISGRIDIRRLIGMTFLCSGALAGLAGAVEVSGRSGALYEGLSPGWGYTAIAVALLARLHPLGVIATGVVFGALEAGAGALQRELGIPAVWVRGIEALVILGVLAAERGLKMMPAVDDPSPEGGDLIAATAQPGHSTIGRTGEDDA